MTRRRTRRTLRHDAPHARALAGFFLLFFTCASGAPQFDAASFEDYRARVTRATEAMEELHQAFDETDDANAPEFLARERRVFADVRAALPAREKLEGAGV
ncbi:MAG TPA: hypothetical protein VER76_11340, partial [Pyrinomonadaceae bacterium]|nr:hypothetical protein [Pyrinomonadaceae bacterium]